MVALMIKALAPIPFCRGGFLQLEASVMLQEGPFLHQMLELTRFGFFLVGNMKGKLLKGNERRMLALWGLGGEAGALFRSWLWKCDWFRRAVRGEMWWNLFSSNPCWVCHNNRFDFCGICWPLTGCLRCQSVSAVISALLFWEAEKRTRALSIRAAAPG